jgi:hypothetical protein
MSEFRVTRKPVPSPAQRVWLSRGLDQPGGKLPLFDDYGKQIDPRTVQACIEQGWAEPWFSNPIKRDWLVCKLTAAGRQAAAKPSARPGRIHAVREHEKTIA